MTATPPNPIAQASEPLTLSDEERKAVEKAIGEPFMEDFSDKIVRIRRNLLFVASLALVFKVGGLGIAVDSSLFGVKLTGLTNEKIETLLLLLLTYLFVSFAWNSLSHFHEWRLRLTGSKVAFITGARWGGEHEDTPDNPRQSTLFTFLIDRREQLSNLEPAIKQLEGRFPDWSDRLDKIIANGENGEIDHKLQNYLDDLSKDLSRIRQTLSYIDRIPVSLERFRRWFLLFQISQLCRWSLLEWGVPMGLAGWALYELWPW